jgi:hypothetical protein
MVRNATIPSWEYFVASRALKRIIASFFIRSSLLQRYF